MHPLFPAREPARLAGTVCLVTGGAQGIGLAVTRALLLRGARVHAVDISPRNIAAARDELRAETAAGAVTFHELDVGDGHALTRCVTAVHAAEGRLDILVNNAAFTQWRDVEDMTVEDAERTMRTGYDALLHGVKAALPLMRAAGGGHIVTMGSSAGIVFVQGPSAAYAAMKAAVHAYSHVLAEELHASPIHVTVVRPGTVTGTDFFAEHVPWSRLPRLADLLPAATPGQVAEAVLDGIVHRRPVVDVPGYVRWVYRAYALAPGVLTRAARLGGPARAAPHPPRPHPQPPPPGLAHATPAPTPTPRPLARLAARLSERVAASALAGETMRRVVVPVDRLLHHHSDGRWSLVRPLGVPTLLLTSTGSRSGRPRRSPLIHVVHRDGYAVVGSNFGRPEHPAWTTNLLRTPRAGITIAGRVIPVIARPVDGPEREEIWQRFLARYPGYRAYADRSGRDLRVFHLRARPPGPAADRPDPPRRTP
ncbi:SDR family NAD(P)-dependent oxidoreductase (plasmid) [Streptomyces sp. BI20]|uniref:SDR family NAD(P)-dependent oxidoreductase n=1 Tax=Streptomyces sp. BI20 TaxID=3403460 RepID=UPI003C70852D